MRAVLKALLCVCLTTAVTTRAVRQTLKQSEACQELTTSADVKTCVESLTISKQKVLDMINLVNTTVQVYPYTTILKDRQATEYYYAEPVLLEDQLQQMYDKVTSEPTEEVSLIDYYAQIVSIVNSAHDGHFVVLAQETDTELHQLAQFEYFIPFDLRINSTGAHIQATFITPSDIVDILYDNGGWVQSIDGKKPDVWVAELAPMCNSMKSQQGRYIENYNRMHGEYVVVPFTMCPDMEAIFKDYTVVLESGATFTFNFQVRFIGNDQLLQTWAQVSELHTLGLPPIPDESAAFEALKSFNKMLKARAHMEQANTSQQVDQDLVTSDKKLQCSVLSTETNYLGVYSFDTTNYFEYLFILYHCAVLFNSNTYPILVDVRGNPGGSTLLSKALFMLLFPQADSRSLYALRPSRYDTEFFLFPAWALEYNKYGTCKRITTLDDDWYRNTVTYTYGEQSDVRTQSFFETSPLLWQDFDLIPILTQNPRSQSDVFILTDGFCASVCSKFVNQARETHSAITVGVNAYPSGTSFEDSQLDSTVINPGVLSQEFMDMGEAAGLNLRMSYLQSFTINDQGITSVPHDFQHHQVDLLLKDVTIDKDLEWEQQLSLLIDLSVQLKQSSNSTNCIDGTYRRSACNAGEHGIGAMVCKGGVWDTTTCVLHACELGYVLNATTNQCVLDVCNPPGPTSPVPSSEDPSSTPAVSSSSTSPSPVSSSHPLTSPSTSPSPSAASTLCVLSAAVVAALTLMVLP